MGRLTDLATMRRPAKAARALAATTPPILSEAFSGTAFDAGVGGFALAHVARGPAPVLWVQDRLSEREAGRPCLAGLGPRRAVLHVSVSGALDALRAMEEGLRCDGLAAVIGEIWGDAPALDFTATKRLALRAEGAIGGGDSGGGGLPCWLLRRAARPTLSAARDRWRIGSLPSAPHPDDPKAPGAPRWRAELFRSRRRAPGEWVASYDDAADRIHLHAPLRDGAAAPTGRDGGRRAIG